MNDKKLKVGIFPLVGDLLHVGHITALNEAKSYCDILVVALNCNPCDVPGKSKPIETVYERYRRVKALSCVDVVIPYEGEADLELLLRTTDHDVRFIGSDHQSRGLWTGMIYERHEGIETIVIQRSHELSSTSLKKRIKDRINSEER